MSKSKLSKYFKFPLEHSNHGNFITDQNGHKFVDMLTYNYKVQDIVDCLNGVKKCTKDYDIVVISRGDLLYSNEQPFMSIRGWGYLTGKGSLGLSDKKAIEIQNMMNDYIIKCLTCKEDGK